MLRPGSPRCRQRDARPGALRPVRRDGRPASPGGPESTVAIRDYEDERERQYDFGGERAAHVEAIID